MLTFISNLLQSNPLKLDQVVQTIQALLKAGHLDCDGLSALPEPVRSRMVALIRDVLCGYPTPRMGLPLLIQWDSDDPDRDKTPIPLPLEIDPLPNMIFQSWARPSDDLTATRLQKNQQPWLISATPSVVVALFDYNAAPGEDPFPIRKPLPRWWWESLADLGGTLTTSARTLLPYPDALEAARVCHSVLALQNPPERLFLSEELFSFSQQTALDFLAQIPAPETRDWNDPALDI